MDPNASSWLGEVCQKFEAMCVEVKYVGDCVKKFCSDAIDELFPLSLDDPMEQENPDPMELENPEWNLYMGTTHEKPIIRNQLKSLDSKLNFSGYCNLSNLSESPSPDSTCFNDESEEKLHPSEISMLQETPKEDGVATISNSGSSSALLSEDGECTVRERKMCNETNERRDIVECIVSTSGSSPGPVLCNELENDNDTLIKSEGMSYELADDEIESNADVKEEHQVQMSEQVGMSYEPAEDEIESNADVKEELQVQVSEQFSKIKLDESCVLVDKCGHISTADLQGKQRSYKKKIQEVFQLRRWSSSKYKEQLEARHRNNKSSPLESDTINIQSNSLESGWEIL